MTKLEKLIAAWNATGRCAFYYPRKKLVSLNGHKAVPVKEAIAQMTEVLSKGA